MDIRLVARTCRRRAALAAACLFLAAGIGLVEARAEEGDAARAAHVCLVKTDRTGGEIGFIVAPEDAPTFERAGFVRADCPATLDRAAASLAARCERFEAMDANDRQMLADLLGLSVEQMCASTRNFTRARARG